MKISKRDVFIIAGIVVLAGILFLVTRLIGTNVDPEAGENPDTILEGMAEDYYFAQEAPSAFLQVFADNIKYKPVPLVKEGTHRLTNTVGEVNEFHVTKDSVVMAYASCDNQLCIHQGVVTLENKDYRPMQNEITCLPNRVNLLLFSSDEVLYGRDLAYLQVTAGESAYAPVPVIQEGKFTVPLENGKECVFTVENGEVGIIASSCMDQACVAQGKISIESTSHALHCDENQVILTLFSQDEINERELQK